MAKPKILIASNRLPLTYDAASSKFTPSSGGLVTALRGIRWDETPLWVGTLPESQVEAAKEKLSSELDGFRFFPVTVEDQDYADYYGGLSNSALWPLLHYENQRVEFHWSQWETYKKVNRLFAERIHEVATAGDLVWVHDYQLFLVPQYLRALNPDLRNGFFLHVPFPSSEVFRQIPVREEILAGLLEADLVGFHDYSYLRHFCTSTQILLGAECNMLWVDHKDRTARLGVFPVSIDLEEIRRAAASPAVEAKTRNYWESQMCAHTILGVDRLDYSKGLDLKLLAFREMLRQFPELVGKVTLVQIAVPTRADVPEYQRLKASIEQLVGEINGEFGAPHYVPIQYLYGSVSFDELIALYRSCELLLVTSKRDGMNLVALEYLVAQSPENPGTVLLSEFTGAGSTLSGVVLINPWDVAKTGKAIGETLLHPLEGRRERQRIMLQYLESYDATAWAKTFLDELARTRKSDRPVGKTIRIDVSRPLPAPLVSELATQDRLLLIDYDGTLCPISDHPETALLPAGVRDALHRLSQRPGWEIVVVSGRPRSFLAAQLAGLDVSLAVEHGALYRGRGQSEWKSRVPSNKTTWFDLARRIMSDYAARVPRSFVEEKENSLSWHYRLSPEEFARYQSRKIYEDLEMALSNFPAKVLTGKKVIEAKAMEADKGAFAGWLLNEQPALQNRVVVAMGDDDTDEDLFSTFEKNGITVRVGREETRANYRLTGQSEVLSFLERLIAI